jgi:hypothetical protein
MTDPPTAKRDAPTRIEAEREGSHVAILVDGDRRFTVRTGDLADIAAQVRGKKPFSVFNSIVLPIMISVLTVLGTTLVGQTIQYVSWRNSTRLQDAIDHATRAREAYERASKAVGERIYSTTLFVDAVRELANRAEDVDSHLFKLDLALLQGRFNAFYGQLKTWNETYDQMLSDIDFHLDRPLLQKPVLVRSRDTGRIKCEATLIEQLRANHLEPSSLKLMFAVLNSCFARALDRVRPEKDRSVLDKTHRFDPAIAQTASELNNSVRAMSNEFRCVAQSRIAYFETQKQRAVFKLSTWASERLDAALGRPRDSAAAYLEATTRACDPTLRS